MNSGLLNRADAISIIIVVHLPRYLGLGVRWEGGVGSGGGGGVKVE